MATPTSSSNPAPARILIVDDHPNTAVMLARVLTGFETPVEVLTACSGEEALELVGEGVVDILITDFMMPGMSGLELVEKLKGREPTHTILITAYDTPGLELTARRLNIQDYLVKPVQPEKIREIVVKVLGSFRPRQSLNVPSRPIKQTKILIADDYPENIRLLSVRLQSEGFMPIVAVDGEEALSKVRTEMPEMVLLDINMPKKDGFEVLSELRADPETANIPVIVITATRIGRQDIRHGLSLGADDYITKPFDWPEVVARIRSKLRVKQAEDALRQRNKELGLLPEIGRELRPDLDISEMASLILKRAVETTQATKGELAIFYNDGNVFYQTYPKTDNGSAPSDSAIAFQGIVPVVMASHYGVLIEDTHKDERWMKGSDPSARSVVAAPLLSQEEVTGVLTLMHNEPGYFNASHLTLLQAITSQAAIAIENSQLYNQEQLRTHDLVALHNLALEIQRCASPEELWEFIPQNLQKCFGYPATAIWRAEPAGLILVNLEGKEKAPRASILAIAAQQALVSSQPVQISGANEKNQGIRQDPSEPLAQAALAIPLTWNGKVRGVLSIHSVHSGAFHEYDRIILETLALQISNSFERFAMLEELNSLRQT